jgi:signal peptidase I
MSPTFQPGAIRLGARVSSSTSLSHGDIVYFQYPHKKAMGRKESVFVARICGLPGDRIAFKDGILIRNGEAVKETYVSPENQDKNNREEIIVPQNRYFLLHDNRKIMGKKVCFRDSEFLGAIARHHIIGKVSE